MTALLNQSAPALKAPRGSSDSSHWYGHDSSRGFYPLYSPDKSYTMREARKDKQAGIAVVPSVTTVISEVKKKQVDDWKMEQVAKAAWRLHKQFLFTDESLFIDQVLGEADRASHPARDLGTAIHAAIELAVAGKDYDAAMDVYVQPVLQERANYGLVSIAQEKCVGSLEYGYAGKVDDICEGLIISDYKSRGEAKDYPSDWAQIAAYGHAEFGDDFFRNGAGIVFPIGTKTPGVVKPVMKTGAALRPAFEAFLGLTASWRFFHSFDPRVVATA